MTHARLRRFFLVAAVYLGVSALWIYSVLDRGTLEGNDVGTWLALAVLAVGHVVFGYAVRDWPALLLPILALGLAIPAGYPASQYGEPSPTWFAQYVLIPAEIVLIAAGLGLRALVDRRRATMPNGLPS
jgi:hypothetical protein